MFVDYYLTERELIKQVLPMVEVPALPYPSYELPVFFKDLVVKYFRVYSITSEDKRKIEQ